MTGSSWRVKGPEGARASSAAAFLRPWARPVPGNKSCGQQVASESRARVRRLNAGHSLWHTPREEPRHGEPSEKVHGPSMRVHSPWPVSRRESTGIGEKGTCAGLPRIPFWMREGVRWPSGREMSHEEFDQHVSVGRAAVPSPRARARQMPTFVRAVSPCSGTATGQGA